MLDNRLWSRAAAVLAVAALVSLALVIGRPGVARADDWGCNLVNTNTGLGLVDDCGNSGSCCDAHDDGYRQGNCTQSSWFHTMCALLGQYCGPATFCDEVNLQAVICITQVHPGPGLCCDFMGQNICQQARNPNNYWGCNGDWWCGAGSRCDLASGTCVPICTGETPTQCGVSWTDSCGNTYPPVGCPDPLQCVNGTCVRCQPATCDAFAGQCGSFDDGCGGTLSCGCPDSQSCESGVCTAPVCTPLTCDDFGTSGTFWDGCSDYITCDFGDPGSGSGSGDPGGGWGDPGGGGGDGCDLDIFDEGCCDPFEDDWCDTEWED